MDFDITIFGSSNYDINSQVDVLPQGGETIFGNTYVTTCGGKGTNQCTQAARLGSKTALISKIGEDLFADKIISHCKNEGIDTSHVFRTSTAGTGIALVTVDKKGENAIIVIPGANFDWKEEDVEQCKDILRRSRVLLCQGEINPHITLAALKLAKSLGCVTVFNMAPAISNMHEDFFKFSDAFIVNAIEASQITNAKVLSIPEAKCAAKNILMKGCKYCIVTLGAEGVVFASENELFHVEATEIDVVDTTGAGDSFVGAFGYYLSKFPDLDMKEVVKRCSYIAAQAVTKLGAESALSRFADLPISLFEKNSFYQNA